MAIFYTSDHHFNHGNILEYADRPFSSVEEMNEVLISNYNSVVADGDLVFFLGDIFFSDKKWAEEAMKRLKGTKHLVMGNHDRISVSRYRAWGFDQIHKKSMLAMIGNDLCGLCHYPTMPESWGVRYVLHGHVHSQNKRMGSRIHIGVDAWNYFPVPESEVIKLIQEHKEEIGE